MIITLTLSSLASSPKLKDDKIIDIMLIIENTLIDCVVDEAIGDCIFEYEDYFHSNCNDNNNILIPISSSNNMVGGKKSLSLDDIIKKNNNNNNDRIYLISEINHHNQQQPYIRQNRTSLEGTQNILKEINAKRYSNINSNL